MRLITQANSWRSREGSGAAPARVNEQQRPLAEYERREAVATNNLTQLLSHSPGGCADTAARPFASGLYGGSAGFGTTWEQMFGGHQAQNNSFFSSRRQLCEHQRVHGPACTRRLLQPYMRLRGVEQACTCQIARVFKEADPNLKLASTAFHPDKFAICRLYG